MRYLINKAGIYTGTTKGQRTPHGSILYPSNAIDEAPPRHDPDEKVPKWTGSKWSLVESPRAIERKKQEAEVAEKLKEEKLKETTPEGAAKFYLDSTGNVVPYTPQQIVHNIKVSKRMQYLSQRHSKLELAYRGILLATISDDADLTKKLLAYRDAVVAIGPTITADTDIDRLEWPKMPDISSVDPTYSEDILS